MRLKQVIYFAICLYLLSSCSSKQQTTKDKTSYGNKKIDTSLNNVFKMQAYLQGDLIQPDTNEYDFFISYRTHKWRQNKKIYEIKSYDSIIMISYREIIKNKDDEPFYDLLEKNETADVTFEYTSFNKLVSYGLISSLMDIITASTQNLHAYRFVGMHDSYGMKVRIKNKQYVVTDAESSAETMLKLDSAFTHTKVFEELINKK